MPLVLLALFLKGCAENGPVYRPTAAENAGVQDRCCSALRMWTKPAARSSSPSRRPMPPCTSRKKCIRAALRSDSDNKNLSRFPVDFTGTSGEVFLLFLSGKPMLLCQRDRSGIPLRQPPPMRPWTTKLTLTSRNCLLYYWPNCCHHRQVHARVNLFHN